MKKHIALMLGMALVAIVGCAKNPMGPSPATVYNPPPVVVGTATASPTPGVPAPTATPTPVATHSYYVVITDASATPVASTFSIWVGKFLGAPTTVTQAIQSLVSPTFSWISFTVTVNPATEVFHMEGICASHDVIIAVYKDGVLLANWVATAGAAFSIND